ncbi:DUF4236 domain-containing protein [Streptomyces spirodelae]|uniref:DUF4236 domain-containing protein n=1 Tax=Streptomyces spirodelae TaxID=2812904 RepID=A0ABS3WT91_9ACTN|nr:DUF4236 domain-containing protein [Streptomyces spirodelae]MBO8186343.1 DUF4236 domain-containing protein [Streptomyces spirodelae]
MGLARRKSFRILPGVRMNIRRRSVSFTTGGGHSPRRTRRTSGRRTTSLHLPGRFGQQRTVRRLGRSRTVRH